MSVSSQLPPQGEPPTQRDDADQKLSLRATFTSGLATFGGAGYGYDAGCTAGILAMNQFKLTFGSSGSDDPDAYVFDGSSFMYSTIQKSLITSIFPAGTFIGALSAGYFCDRFGRKRTIIAGGVTYMVGVAIQIGSQSVGLLVGGRFVAGLGSGIVSSAVILYTSEITAKRSRGKVMSCYQWSIAVGLLIASGVVQGTKDLQTSAAYRIPMGLQFLWTLILIVGMLFMPESPRWYIMMDRKEEACTALCRLRSQEPDSGPITRILAELTKDHDEEKEAGAGSGSWADCFRGGWNCGSNLQLTLKGIGIQAMQQLIGINFIFYYQTTFFKHAGVANPFLITLITNIVNVVSTPISFWVIDRAGRRALLLLGAACLALTQFTIAIVSSVAGNEAGGASQTVLIVFTCFFISIFAWTWGATCWTVTGEIYPVSIRARGVGLATSSNWLVNFALAFSTPYLVDEQYGNLGGRVFYIWGCMSALAFGFAYFCVWETRKLSLEEVNKMVVEVTPWNSVKYNKKITDPKGDMEMGLKVSNELSEVEDRSQKSEEEEKQQRNGFLARIRRSKKRESPTRMSSSES